MKYDITPEGDTEKSESFPGSKTIIQFPIKLEFTQVNMMTKLKSSVLLIEDETTQRRILENHLERQGYDVISAQNGKEGLEVWEKQPGIRLVITDLEMPEVGGLQVVETIRAKEDCYTYIMVITEMKDKESLLQALALGADDYINKPLLAEELKLRLVAANRLLRLEDHDRLVISLAELAAERSGELGSHLKRTKEYIFILGSDICATRPDLELTQQDVHDLSNISVLHDIGMIGIPDRLLSKRGRLTREEFKVVQKHTIIGAHKLEKLLAEAESSFLQIGYDLVFTHHERWDGSGYPQGLKGEAIPISGRIMALADTYDTLRNRKSYKDAYSLEHVEAIIENEKGKQFDPQLVDAYLRNREQFDEIHERYPDSDSL